ncbi:hypothetical protein D3C71_2041280 [compost metagenome]
MGAASSGAVAPWSGRAPSGNCPRTSGDLENARTDKATTVVTMEMPMTTAACANPIEAMSITHKGEKITPPTLAPL